MNNWYTTNLSLIEDDEDFRVQYNKVLWVITYMHFTDNEDSKSLNNIEARRFTKFWKGQHRWME